MARPLTRSFVPPVPPSDELEREEQESDEARLLRRARYKAARRAGLSIVEAQLFADAGPSMAELRHLCDLGCEPTLIARIVL